jgi:hypothetical protein
VKPATLIPLRRWLHYVLWIGLPASLIPAAVALRPLFMPLELPDPRYAYKEVFPSADFRQASSGSSVARVYGSFGKLVPPSAHHDRCIYFQYDPDLSDSTLVLSVAGDLIRDRWLVRAGDQPEQCAGLARETVDLRGWYAASVTLCGGDPACL